MVQKELGAVLHRLWFVGWGFDGLYHRVFVGPYIWVARANREDFIDSIYDGLSALAQSCHRGLSRTETGQVCLYAMGIAVGAIVVITIVVFS